MILHVIQISLRLTKKTISGPYFKKYFRKYGKKSRRNEKEDLWRLEFELNCIRSDIKLSSMTSSSGHIIFRMSQTGSSNITPSILRRSMQSKDEKSTQVYNIKCINYTV